MAKSEDQNEDRPWWAEDASEFEFEDGAYPETGGAEGPDSSELLNTAAQEAVKLASTLSTWAEQTGFGDILKMATQQAVEVATDAAASLLEVDEPAEGADAGGTQVNVVEVEVVDEADLEQSQDDVDLDSDDFAHLDDDPADSGVAYFKTESPESGHQHALHAAEPAAARITCDYCPVCRIIESLDELNPETAAAIAEVMAVVTDGVASAVMELIPKNSGDDD